MSKVEYGLQMFSLRDIARDDLEAALRGTARLGYKYVELTRITENPAEKVKGWLDELGLICCATHTGLALLTPETIDETTKIHKILNCDYLVIPNAPFGEGKEEAERIIEAMNFAQKKLAENGIGMAYHNHSREFFPTPFGMVFEDEVINRTSLDLELDTFWSFNSGVDTLAFLEKYKSRIKIVHLRDGIPSAPECKSFERCQEGVVGKSLGEGLAPVKEVREWAIKNNVRMVIESGGCNPTGLEESERCIKYLRSLE